MSSQLSATHMVQHMLLMMLAAPLLALGSPGFVMLWALPLRWRRGAGPWLRCLETGHSVSYRLWQPVLIWSVYAITLWIWHLPALYQAALRRHLVHEIQHLAFLLTAFLFWRVLLDPIGRLKLSRGAGVLYLFATSLHAGALGAFMTLSPRAWYPAYAATTPAWGLTPLADQQLAGLIMWMPACSIYALAAAAMFFTWLREAEARSETRGEVRKTTTNRDDQDGQGEQAVAWTAGES
jgi:putative membrane protein